MVWTKGQFQGLLSLLLKHSAQKGIISSNGHSQMPIETRSSLKADFFSVGGFPNVIGAVDGTNVRIQAPHEDEASFVNRKGFHSINVHAICDTEGKILAKNYYSIQFTLNLNPLQH